MYIYIVVIYIYICICVYTYIYVYWHLWPIRGTSLRQVEARHQVDEARSAPGWRRSGYCGNMGKNGGVP
jgi:hypothetical protein